MLLENDTFSELFSFLGQNVGAYEFLGLEEGDVSGWHVEDGEGAASQGGEGSYGPQEHACPPLRATQHQGKEERH